ncbi:hypothetical protein LC653_00540 [Nostoc sp. CHAB 5784]|uniref:hypothetical protein n=1 Tax=Nostoc mirabile TaxID=2907820 RepID=UPI001E65BB36|nr:hypothetical protein [Nostoc mirabile]MCC5662457.1 hypothetical protein [Nostoc mirabile CHAB5784]
MTNDSLLLSETLREHQLALFAPTYLMLGFVPQPNLHWSYFLGLTEQYCVRSASRSHSYNTVTTDCKTSFMNKPG